MNTFYPSAADGIGPDDAMKASLSALADGQADACDEALRAWSSDAEARAAWHRLHLAADVLRSEELAATAAHDEAFLQALRVRLDAEPTVLAPVLSETVLPAQAVGAVGRAQMAGRRGWWAYGAAAAGFLAVGVVAFSLNNATAPAGQGERLAGVPSGAVGAAVPVALGGQAASARAESRVAPDGAAMRVVAGASASSGGPVVLAADPQWRTLDGQVIRDARLDAYLYAHRGSPAVSGRFQTVVLEK